MPRLASLFLPDLAIDRIRRQSPSPAGGRETAAAQRLQGEGASQRLALTSHTHPIPFPHAGGRVLVTANRSGNRLLLAAVSPEARAAGLVPGMALAQARALVPGLDVRDSDPEGDAALLDRLGLVAARRWTPRAAVAGADGLRLDLSGVAHLFGGERALAERILRFCGRLGLAARIAVADTYGAAHAFARFGGEHLNLNRDLAALAPLPLAALRLDEPALATARRLGLETIGQLIAMPRAPLQRRFGPDLLTRLDQALGRAAEPFDPIVPEEPPSVLLRFLEPIATPEAIAEATAEAVRRLVAELQKAGLGARRLVLAGERVDGEAQIVRVGTARATRDGGHLTRLLTANIENIDPGFGLDRLSLTATRVEPLGAQAIASELAGDRPPPDLALLIDRLASRLGARRLHRLGAVESDVPERSVRRFGPLAKPPAWPDWPRPVRLLSPPERVDGVVALLPDQPPRLFTWRGRPHRVVRADGPERIYGEWWKRRAETDAVRDYFQVEDEAGRRFWLFRRGDGANPATGDLSWYLHGVFG